MGRKIRHGCNLLSLAGGKSLLDSVRHNLVSLCLCLCVVVGGLVSAAWR